MGIKNRLMTIFRRQEGKQDGKQENGKAIKAIGAGWNQVATVMPQGDTFLHFLSLASEEDYPQYIRIQDPYLDNSWVFAAIQVMAINMAQVPFKLYNGENEIEESGQYMWLWRLFNNVAPYYNRYALIESIPLWLSLRGEVFWRIIRSDLTGRTPTRIRILEPDYMREIVRDGEIVQWVYETGGGNKDFIDPEDIIQFKYYNPYNRFRGMSPLTAAMLGLHIDYSAAAFNYYFFNNQATPGGVLTTPSETITDREKDAIELRWKKKHRGLKRTGIMAVLSHGAKYEQISLAQKDIEYINQKKWAREEVFAVLMVPPALCQVLEYASIKSNIKEQRIQLYENNLIPKMKMVEDVLRTDFFDREGLTGISGRFDLEQVEALKENLTEKIKHARLLWQMGFTANEINERLQLGFEDKPWRDQWWTTINMMPISGDGTEALQIQQGNRQNNEGSEKPEKLKEAKDVKDKTFDREYTEGKKIWKRLIRRITPIENEYAKKLQEYFYKIRQDVLSKILGEKSILKKEIKAGGYDINELLFSTEYDAIIQEISRGSFEKAYGLGIESVGIETTFSLTNVRAMDSLSKRIRAIKEINETVREQLLTTMQPILKEGLREGLAYDTVAGKLAEAARGVLNNAKNRAKTIARTEINGAMNQARYDTMKETGIEKHRWTTSLDSNVRDSHVMLEGQVRTVDEYFDNGLQFPHDPAGDPAEVINCRCIAVPVTEE